ncbi:MAG: DUF2064 domain-containing protein [Chitinophagales bacterium]
MPDQTRQVAVLLFTRSPQEEARYKAFAGAGKQALNTRIAESLIGHAEKIIRNSGLPAYIIDSAHQKGNSFGEKFAHAMQQVFAKGFEHVISIGNDCLHLQASDLQKAARELRQKKVVFGPAKDGGLYLIGMHRSVFNANSFSALHWDTPNVMDEMLERFAIEPCDSEIFAELADADSGAQLEHLLYTFYTNISLRAFLLSLIASVHDRMQEAAARSIDIFRQRSKSLRAPPAC